MSNRTLSNIRANAKEILNGKVTSKAALLDALPVLIELGEAVKSAKNNYDSSREVLAELNDACAAYALAHESVFDEGLMTSAKGVKMGDITIDDVVYHLASGYDSPKRLDGDPLSQDFLAALPKDWAKASLKLDTTGINRMGISEEELEANGLCRPEKNAWSASEAVA